MREEGEKIIVKNAGKQTGDRARMNRQRQRENEIQRQRERKQNNDMMTKCCVDVIMAPRYYYKHFDFKLISDAKIQPVI